ncbi:MAG: sulfite exporter TauE/SafE family protein [Chloroflexota bacterium]
MVTVLAALAVALAATVAGFSGFGFSLFGAPALLFLYDPRTAVVITLLLGLITTAGSTFVPERGAAVQGRTVALMCCSGLLGIPLGALLLGAADPGLLKLAAGLLAMGYGGLGLSGRFSSWRVLPAAPAALAAGLLAGLLSTSTALNGPPLVIYFAGRGSSKEEFRSSVSATLLVLGAASLLVLYARGYVDVGALASALPLLPGLLAGFAVGVRLYKVVPRAAFARLILVGLVGIGLASVLGGLHR